MPSVDTTKNAPPMARASQLTPQPQNTGTAAASARNGTSRNVRMVMSSAIVCRPESTGFGAGRAGLTGVEVVMQSRFAFFAAPARPGTGGRGSGTPGGQLWGVTGGLSAAPDRRSVPAGHLGRE